MQRRQLRSSNVGVSPTQAQKLAHISKKLGLPGITKQQGAAFNLFDTVIITNQPTQRQTLTFFTQTQGKVRTFTNFQSGILNAGEALLVEYVQFFHVVLTSTNLTTEANLIQQINPLSGLVALSVGINMSMMNFNIANDTVVKDFLIHEGIPSFNPDNTGIAIAGLGSPEHGSSFIKLPATPVIPPNQKIKVTLEVPAIDALPVPSAIVCVLGRFGSIFSAKTTL